MFKWKILIPLSATAYGVYAYNQNKWIKKVYNLGYAGFRMAAIYKFSSKNIIEKNIQASEFLRDALRKNGGIYLKLGQLIATLDVIVPDEYRMIMSQLTRNCQVQTFQSIKKTVEGQLNYPINVVFRQFEEQPISSASIAQVHRGVLLNGQKVAIKVQHSQLADNIEQDLLFLKKFNKLAKYLFKQFNYDWFVEAFQKNIRTQLDFEQEVKNMRRTRRFLEQNNFQNIYIPKIYLKPTKKLLVMEYIDGIHLDEVDKMKKSGINMKKIGRLFSSMIIKMIHKQGFVHADPHCGNLMVRKNEKKKIDQLILLDHGIYQQLDAQLILNYNQFWLGLILNDQKIYDPAARKLGASNPKMLCQMLTSKTQDEFNSLNRKLFDLNPSSDKQKIITEATKNHGDIVKTLSELKRQILFLLKVNEFARTIQNIMEGREMGVYQDIAKQCVRNMNFSWFARIKYYFKMWNSN